MRQISTASFDLAVYQKGSNDASKLAIVIPGLLDTKDYPHMRSHVDFLAKEGFLALSFDPPGTWESGAEITKYTTSNCLEAIDELIQYFDRPTFIMGHSNGGRLSMLASVRNPLIYAFCSIMSAPTFIRDRNREDRTIVWKKERVKISYRDLPNNPGLKRKFELPYSFCEDAMKYDAREGLGSISIPKLFIGGKDDMTTTPDEVKEAYEAAGEPKQLLMLDSDHNYRWHTNLIDKVNELVLNFLVTNKQ